MPSIPAVRRLMLSVRNLTVTLSLNGKKANVLDTVSFDVKPGESYALVGESGCGKSMTALAIMRLLPDTMKITAGDIYCDGDNLLDLTEKEMAARRGKKIAMIFQEPSTSLNPVMTIGAQIEEVLLIHGLASGAQAKETALYWLKRVGLDNAESRYGAFPHELSGGQKQRVMIAMALAAKPDLLIADEPTTALDVKIQAQILDLLDELRREEKVALLLITHDLALVRQYADRVALMYSGFIVEECGVKEFFALAVHPYAQGLLKAVPRKGARGKALEAIKGVVPPLFKREAGCPFADRCALRSEACGGDVALRKITAEHTVRCLKPGEKIQSVAASLFEKKAFGRPVLEIQDGSVAYRSKAGFFKRARLIPVVQKVNLTLREGETLALVGESGSGKTTLAKAVLRLLEETAEVTGTFRIDQIDVLRARTAELKKLRSVAQIVFQDPFASLNPRMTIGACLKEAMQGVRISSREKHSRAAELLRFVGLDESALKRFPHEFSGGQRQRIAIARALAVNPKVIVCDEPTSALDVSVQAQILNLMRRIQSVTGIAYLLITHNFAVVEYLADCVAVMQNGKIIEVGDTPTLLREPKQSYTRELLKAVPRL